MHATLTGLASVLLQLRPASSWKPLAVIIVLTVVFLLVGFHLVALLRRGPRGPRGQRITKIGGVFSLVTLAIAIVALHTKINLLVMLFGTLLSALVLSFVLSRMAMRKLSFERRVPSGIYPDRPFTVELRAGNRKRWVSTYGLAVWDELPEGIVAEQPGGVILQLRPGDSSSLAYTAAAVRRGVYWMSTVTFSTRFPFGFFHQERARSVGSEVVVYPRLGAVAPNLLGRAHSLAQTRRRAYTARGEEEFRNLREYRLGDNPRWIHWKTSAKLGEPLVKEYEAVVTERAFIVLDTRSRASGDEPLETAISFAASLARDLMLRDFFVSLAAYAPDLVVTAGMKGSAGLHALLDILARLEPNPRCSLVELADEPRVRAEERILTVAVLLHTDEDAASAIDRLQARKPRVLAIDASAPSLHDIFNLRA